MFFAKFNKYKRTVDLKKANEFSTFLRELKTITISKHLIKKRLENLEIDIRRMNLKKVVTIKVKKSNKMYSISKSEISNYHAAYKLFEEAYNDFEDY